MLSIFRCLLCTVRKSCIFVLKLKLPLSHLTLALMVLCATSSASALSSRWDNNNKGISAEHSMNQSGGSGENNYNSGTGSQDDPDYFDYYAFAQFLWIEECHSSNNASQNCTFIDKMPELSDNLAVHGLWPSRAAQSHNRKESKNERNVGRSVGPLPAYCQKGHLLRKDLSESLKIALKGIGWVDYGFLDHEWTKHGTCATKLVNKTPVNMTKEEYFSQFIALYKKFPMPAIVRSNFGKQASYHDIVANYGGEKCAELRCSSYKGDPNQYLHTIIIPLSKDDLHPICQYVGTPHHGVCDATKPIYIREPNLNAIIN